jgi:hypothetical protein
VLDIELGMVLLLHDLLSGLERVLRLLGKALKSHIASSLAVKLLPAPVTRGVGRAIGPAADRHW